MKSRAWNWTSGVVWGGLWLQNLALRQLSNARNPILIPSVPVSCSIVTARSSHFLPTPSLVMSGGWQLVARCWSSVAGSWRTSRYQNNRCRPNQRNARACGLSRAYILSSATPSDITQIGYPTNPIPPSTYENHTAAPGTSSFDMPGEIGP